MNRRNCGRDWYEKFQQWQGSMRRPIPYDKRSRTLKAHNQKKPLMITVFPPSFADEANTNAQNLTAKEIVSRLPPDRFRVILLAGGTPDPRILARENTETLRWTRHGNTARCLTPLLLSKIDIYFFPREGPLDPLFPFFMPFPLLPITPLPYLLTPPH